MDGQYWLPGQTVRSSLAGLRCSAATWWHFQLLLYCIVSNCTELYIMTEITHGRQGKALFINKAPWRELPEFCWLGSIEPQPIGKEVSYLMSSRAIDNYLQLNNKQHAFRTQFKNSRDLKPLARNVLPKYIFVAWRAGTATQFLLGS